MRLMMKLVIPAHSAFPEGHNLTIGKQHWSEKVRQSYQTWHIRDYLSSRLRSADQIISFEQESLYASLKCIPEPTLQRHRRTKIRIILLHQNENFGPDCDLRCSAGDYHAPYLRSRRCQAKRAATKLLARTLAR